MGLYLEEVNTIGFRTGFKSDSVLMLTDLDCPNRPISVSFFELVYVIL